ncbi:hypothetical protein Tco_1501553 [Tanacetum coccineum]
MLNPKFAETYNLVAFLEKPEESDGFEGIIDFLNASSIKYALTVNPTIYTTCIEQFRETAKAKTVNGERQIQALVDKKKVIITETSIRRDLKLDDAEGTDCLPTATIFAELERMGAKTTAWNEFSSTMASAIARKGFFGRVTPLFQTMMVQASEDMGEDSAAPIDSHSAPIITQPSSSKPQKKKSRRKQRKDSGPTKPVTDKATHEEHVSTPSYDPPQSAKTDQAKEIASLKKRVKQLEKRRKSRTLGLKRLKMVGSTSRVESSNDVSLGAQEDASKQGRKIADLDADVEVTLIDETQGRKDEDLMFDTGVLDGDEVFEEPMVNAATTISSIPVSAADPVTTVGEVVTTAGDNVEIPDELTLAKTLIKIKSTKHRAITTAATTVTPISTRPKAKRIVFYDQEEQVPASKLIVSLAQPLSKEKGKGKMVEPEKKTGRKTQIQLDEELAFKMHAKEQEEARRAVIIKELDSIQAMIEADEQLATRL